MRTTTIAVLLALTLSSCATTEGFNKIIQSWVGHDVSHLEKKRGYPSSTIKTSQGNTVYVYGGNVGSMVIDQTMGFSIPLKCTTYYEIDDSGTIVKVDFKGNNCKA